MTSELVDYLVEPLNRQHDRTVFSSGVDPLDRYLRTQARQDADRRVAAVFVLVPAGSTVADAFDRSLRVSDEVASFEIVVDAKGEAARRFYEHYEFRSFPSQQDRLFLPMDTISRLRAP